MYKFSNNGHIGRKIRLNRLLRSDGCAVCVAADFGFMSVPDFNVYYLRSIIKEIIMGQVDGVLLSPGQVVNLADLFNSNSAPSILLRCDWINATRLSSLSENALIPSNSLKRIVAIQPEEAIGLGVTALVSYLFVGYEDKFEAENISSVASLVCECHKIGLPFGIEPIAVGTRVTGANLARILEYGVKLSLELGADFLKVPYSGDIDSFRGIVESAEEVPVLVLGGARSNRFQDAIDMAIDAKNAGARGVVFGRNVTQANDPQLVVKKLCQVFHENSVEKKELGKNKLKIKVNESICTNCSLCLIVCSYKHAGIQGLTDASIKIDRGIFPKIYICNQCGKCIKECDKNALYYQDIGGIGLDVSKCTGCGKCINICPQGIIKMNSKKNIPVICDLCNGEPECVDTCPSGALSLKELIKNK